MNSCNKCIDAQVRNPCVSIKVPNIKSVMRLMSVSELCVPKPDESLDLLGDVRQQSPWLGRWGGC